MFLVPYFQERPMKNDLLKKLTDAIREKGFDQISMSEFGKITNLQKSSLYHHFPGGKKDIVKSILSEVENNLKDHTDTLINSSESPQKKLEILLEFISSFYDQGNKNCLIDVISISNIDTEVQKQIKHLYEILTNAFASVYQAFGLSQSEANQRAEHAIIMIQGSVVVSRAVGHNGPFINVINDLYMKT